MAALIHTSSSRLLAVLSLFCFLAGAPSRDTYCDDFIRGDVDGDGAITWSDVYMLAESEPSYGSSPPACWDALDTNDNGIIHHSDATSISNYLLGSGVIPAPFPAIGADPTIEDPLLDCQVYNNSMQYVKDDLIIVVDRRSQGTFGSIALSTYEYYGITFKAVIDKIIATSSYPNTTALQFFQRWWSGVTGNGSQLATQNPFTGSLNTNPAAYALIAIVNRFDSATRRVPPGQDEDPSDWSTCGTLRLIFGRTGGMHDSSRQNRNLIVFDAAIPNPTPGSPSGCACYYQKWNSLENLSESTQAYILQQMLFVSAGGSGSCTMPPAIHYSHFLSSPGGILANSFIDGGAEYAYRQFKVTQNGYYGVHPIQTLVGDSINLALLQNPIEPALSAFKYYLDTVVPGIAAAEDFHGVSLGSYADIQSFLAQSSRADRYPATPRVDYFGVSAASIRNHIAGILEDLEEEEQGSTNGLDPKNILDRMNSLSCGGCHSSTTIHSSSAHPSSGGPQEVSGVLMRDLGDQVLKPAPFTFHHVNEFGGLSTGMRNVILKKRSEEWAALGY